MRMNQKQTEAAVKKALAFCHTQLQKERAVSKETLTTYFGNAVRPLSQYLRNTLLITTDNHYSKDGRQCKKYICNKEGLQQLMQQYNLSENALEAYTIDAYWPQMLSGMFRYQFKSNRLWHPLQNIKRELRDKMFYDAGYTHKYDIKTAAPSILTQLANQVSQQWTPAIYQFLRDSKEQRQRVATLLDIDYDTAKEILTGLFNGAQLTNNYTAIGKLLTKEQLDILRKDAFVSELRSEIKSVTKTLAVGGDKSRVWDKYFEAELAVMDTAIASHTGKVFRMHDGLYTDTPLNTAISMRDCKNKLNLWIQLE